MAARPDIETAVIGGGAVGLSIAAACARNGQETFLFERRSGLGQEITSRSSEVIHAGIYYPAGSLKASACLAGRRRLYDFAADSGVKFARTGKLIVATSQSEIETLRGLRAKAIANGVDDLVWLDAADARALEPEVACAAALLSPSTGIIDSHGLMVALEGLFLGHAGSVILNTELIDVRYEAGSAFTLKFMTAGEEATLTAGTLIVAAGLGMAGLRSFLPRATSYEPPIVSFAKGHYYSLQGKAPFRHLVYPVPVNGGLGTHLTLDLQGRARFGPDVQWLDRIDYAFDDPEGRRKQEFETSIRRYWPALPPGALEQDYTGIRPKISRPGEPARDFEIHGPERHGVERMVTLYGIESPGLTSCLALADHCLAQLTRS